VHYPSCAFDTGLDTSSSNKIGYPVNDDRDRIWATRMGWVINKHLEHWQAKDELHELVVDCKTSLLQSSRRSAASPPPSPPFFASIITPIARVMKIYFRILRVAIRRACPCSFAAYLCFSDSLPEHFWGLGLANVIAHMLTAKSCLPVSDRPCAPAFPVPNRAFVPRIDAGINRVSVHIKSKERASLDRGYMIYS
jgi:hypothetical protein